MNIFNLLRTLNRPVVYGYHTGEQELPYLCLMGAGQDQFEADTTYYTVQDRYQIEYYFRKKDGAFEAQIEALLLSNGFRYTKSEDIYINDEDVFVIYYDI